MRDSGEATLTTIVVDDEQLACDELSYLLKDFPEVDVIATGSNGLDAIELIRKLEPEVVFLDVHMPGLDGLGVVRRLREKGIDLPHFIFVTAYDQYAKLAFGGRNSHVLFFWQFVLRTASRSAASPPV